MRYKKKPTDEWLAYMLSGGRLGSPPPPDWKPEPIKLDEENENWLHRRKKKEKD